MNKEQQDIVYLMMCRLHGHRVEPVWHNVFNKRKTTRKRIQSYMCITCTAAGKPIVRSPVGIKKKRVVFEPAKALERIHPLLLYLLILILFFLTSLLAW